MNHRLRVGALDPCDMVAHLVARGKHYHVPEYVRTDQPLPLYAANQRKLRGCFEQWMRVEVFAWIFDVRMCIGTRQATSAAAYLLSLLPMSLRTCLAP